MRVPNPTGKGGFKKGQSGNPTGRPKVIKKVQEIAQQYTDDAIKALVDIVKAEKAPPAARVAAAQAILDRGYGKAPQTINANVNIFDELAADELRAVEAAISGILAEGAEGDSTPVN